MPTKVDLHLHTYYSDGRQSPSEAVKLAAKSGVKYLAIADHESTQSLAEVEKYAKQAGIKFIPAVEITTNYEGFVLHILGYSFNPKNRLMQQLFALLLKNREQKVVERMKHIGLFLAEQGRGNLRINDFIKQQKAFFNRWKAQDYLVQNKLMHHYEAAKHLLGVKIAVPDISPATAIHLVHGAGGKAILAHPFGPKISLSFLTKDTKQQNRILKELKEQGLDGLECYTPSHGAKETKQALSFAKKYGLMISAGSDWHGPVKLTGKGILDYIPDYVKAPGQFSVPDDVQKNLIKTFFS